MAFGCCAGQELYFAVTMMQRLTAVSARRALAAAGPSAAVRSMGSGSSGGGHIPNQESRAWEMPRTNKHTSAQNLGSRFTTACGRDFDPVIYMELIQAMTDKSWSQAIQNHLREDAEYVHMIRTKGGGAKTIDAICATGVHDEEFMHRLKTTMQTDAQTALAVCAIQDAYSKIRTKRDENQSQTAADGRDPYGAVKSRNQAQFGIDESNPTGMNM
jgi:hypothetical protein